MFNSSSLINRILQKLTGKSDLAELIRGSGQVYFLKVGGMAAGYLFLLVAANYLPQKAVGIYALSVAFVNFIVIFGRLGFGNALVKIVAQNRAIGKSVLPKLILQKLSLVSLAINILLMIAVFLLVPVISTHVFDKPYMSPFLRFSISMLIPIVLTQIISGYLRGHKKVWQFALINNLGLRGMMCLALAGMLIFSTQIALPIYAWMTGWAFSFLLALWFLFKETPVNSIIPVRTTFIRLAPLLHLSVPMMLTDSMTLMMRFSDTLVLGIFKSPEEIATYHVASRLSVIAGLVLMASTVIAAPKFAELHRNGLHDKLKRLVQKFTLLAVGVSAPLIAALLLLPEDILGLFGKDYNYGKLALMILAAAQFINISTGLVGPLLNMSGHHVFMMWLSVLTLAANISLNFVLIPPYGIIGAALATGSTLVVKNLISFVYVKKVHGFWAFGFS